MKICTKCLIDKEFIEFSRHPKGKFGLQARCKMCCNLEKQNWNRINKDRKKQNTRKWHKENKGYCQKKTAEWNTLNKEHCRERNNAYNRRRYLTDVEFKLAHNLRNRLKDAIKDNLKSGSAVRNLGCSIEQFKYYIESKFKPKMTWDNWSYDGWHLDHIVPLVKFDLTNPEQFAKACHYTNLQPLWKEDHNVKTAMEIIERIGASGRIRTDDAGL